MGFDEFGYMQDSVTASPEMGEAIGIIMGVYLALMLPMLAFTVASYVLQALGMYTVSKRRGIHHAWLSWLPVGNMWILGSISDQYQYVAKGRVRNRRKVLLGIMIAIYALMIVIEVGGIAAAVGAAMGTAAESLAGVMVVLVLALAMMVVSIVGTVFQFMCYYDLFASCDPSNATMFLVLGIIFNVTLPFFVFACRKKDLGMPPRKAQPAAAEVIEPVQPEPAAPVYLQEPVAEEADFEEPAEERKQETDE